MKLPLRILFLCTQNSARSQLAEALLNSRRDPRVIAGSAGTAPADRVNPFALELLVESGIDASAARPKSIDEVLGESWDLVITVCDSARESCPILPGHTIAGHWGMSDPAALPGDDESKRQAFLDTAMTIERRLDRLLALPLETMGGRELLDRVREIGDERVA